MALRIVELRPKQQKYGLPVADSADHRAATVMLLGGVVDLTWMATVGSETVDAWRNYRLDLGIVGFCGFDPIVGATTHSQSEVATKQALIEASSEAIAPIQADKLGTSASYVVAEVDALDAIVVESNAPKRFLQRCRESGVEIVIAE